MMNNCQKCGNPLQPGQTICPICGTTTNETENQGTPVLNTNTVESVTTPQESWEQPSTILSNETLTEVNPVPPVIENPSVVPPINNQIGEGIPSNSTPGVIAPSVMTQNAETPIQGVPTPTPSLDTLAPTVNAIPSATPIPSMPAGTTIVNTTVQPAEPKKKKGKFSRNQKVIVIGALVIMLLVVVGVMTTSKNMTKTNYMNNQNNQNNTATPTPDNSQDNTQIAKKEAVTNGYKLKYDEGWIIEEDSYNVLMKNSDESIVVKLEHFSYELNDFDQSVIESYLAQREGIANPIVEKTTIGEKDAYLMTYNVITQTSTTYPVESYFIKGGANLIIGATIVYQNETIKQVNVNTIVSLMENISYEDESVKALNSINMYYNAFSLYADIIGNSKKEETVIIEEAGEENPIQEENGNGEEVDNNTPDISQNTSTSEPTEIN